MIQYIVAAGVGALLGGMGRKKKFASGGQAKAFKPGDMWSEDFDYEGMIDFAENIDEKTSFEDLEKFADSAEDVNYHTLANPVQDYISSEQTDEDRKRMLNRLMRNLFTI